MIPNILLASAYSEPYIGYGAGTLTQDATNINGTNSSVQALGYPSGINLGVRIYHKFFDQFILGGDGNVGIKNVSMTYLGYTVLGSKDFTFVTTSIGAIAGWDIPTILFPRIWAGYYLDGLGLSQQGSSHSDSYGGSGYKFGVSFDWWIQFGVEYAKHTYKRVNGNSLPASVTQSGVTFKASQVTYDEYIVTLSWPFEISAK